MSLDFIAEMAWKSAAISSVALLILALLRSRSAADRAAVVRLAVVMLLLLPIVSLGLPALQVERPETPPVEMLPIEPVAAPVEDAAAAPTLIGETAMPAVVTAAESPFELPTGLLLTAAYALGAVLLLGRLLAGLWTLRRWTAAAEPVASPVWHGALRRAAAGAGIVAPVQLLGSDDVPSPMSWGLTQPAILIDFDTLARPADADAVLAHEMAHVARRDWAMLMLSRLAVMLFWFNPLVWLLERALIEQAEEAADLRALGRVEPVSYARTLVACGAHVGGVMLPANSIAAGRGLARRVQAVLDEQRRLTPSGSAWTGVAMLLCVLVSAPIAALELVAPKPPVVPTPPTAPQAPAAPAAPLAPHAPAAPVAPAAPAAPQAPHASEPHGDDMADLTSAVEKAVDAEMMPARLAAVEAAAEAAAARSVRVAAVSTKATARAEAAAAAAAATVDVDDLIEMKTHGIDAAYLAELAALAPQRRLSVDEIVQTRIHGLTPGKLRQFADAGYGSIDIDDLVAMQIHGVSPAFIRDMAAAGYRGLDPDDLVAMRIHGVTPERARRATVGGKRPSVEDLVEMTIQGKL